ncbi:hypothetical protein BH11ACT2_BH11ACT2_06000 [soil metagenome]
MASHEPSASDIDVVDRLDILDLYARQSHAVDGGDGDAWARTYTRTGTFSSPTYNLTATGHDELKQFAEVSNGTALARGEQFRHLVTAIAMAPAEPGAIAVRAYLTITATTSEGSRVDRSLVMIDRLEREGGRWLIASRSVHRD